MNDNGNLLLINDSISGKHTYKIYTDVYFIRLTYCVQKESSPMEKLFY